MIEIRNLKKSFGNLQVLKGINTTIKKGEVISIIGPSGTGKSVFMRCLNLLEQPTSGEILIDGENILAKDADICKLRQKMGMVFQSFNLFSHLMIIENIMLGPVDLLKQTPEEAYKEAIRLLHMVGLGDKAYTYPDELSGGQKQRVAIARALAMKPEIILFDEPTSALDPTKVSEVLSVIKRLAEQGLTMMIVTHEMKFARDASTRIFYMDEGGIYEEGTAEDIFENPQREKTQAFIRKIRTLTKNITSKNFDFYAFTAEIEEFGHKQMIAPKQIKHVQLFIEEILFHQLDEKLATSNLELTVSYYEVNGKIEIIFKYGGEYFDPFTVNNQEDDLSLIIVRNMAKNISHTYENDINCLTVLVS